MKKLLLVGLFVSPVFAATSHSNWEGSTGKFTGTITNQAQFDDLIKYTDYGTQAKLKAAFKDGKLTAAEIKDSGISDHHFYTGLLASAKTQGEYDKYLKQMNGGANVDDHFVSNRDLKAHGSMVMNQVDTKIQGVVSKQSKVDAEQNQQLDHLMQGQDTTNESLQDMDKDLAANSGRLDKVVAGLQDLGNHIQAQVPSLPEQNGGQEVVPPLPPVETNKPYDDTQVKEDIAVNADKIQANADKIQSNTDKIQSNTDNVLQMGASFEQRVDKVNDYLSQAGSAIGNNTGRLNNLEGAFAAQAAHTSQEIARMDGRINSLEKKTNKLKAGVAGANAIGSLTQYTGNGTHHVAVGLGGYEGASALAGGYTYAISSNTTVRGTIAYDSEGNLGFGTSVGHSW